MKCREKVEIRVEIGVGIHKADLAGAGTCRFAAMFSVVVAPGISLLMDTN
jgi:hypothetical protein